MPTDSVYCSSDARRHGKAVYNSLLKARYDRDGRTGERAH
jgi:hypothetical protein